MKKKELIKTVGTTIVSVGVGKIIGNAISATTPATPVGLVMKVCMLVGSFALGSLVADKAVEHTEKMVDQTIKAFKEMDEPEKELVTE